MKKGHAIFETSWQLHLLLIADMILWWLMPFTDTLSERPLGSLDAIICSLSLAMWGCFYYKWFNLSALKLDVRNDQLVTSNPQVCFKRSKKRLCQWLANTYQWLVNGLSIFVNDLPMTCPWLVNICEWLVNDLSMICEWHVNATSMTCQGLVKALSITSLSPINQFSSTYNLSI